MYTLVVYTMLANGPSIVLQKMSILATKNKFIFSDEAHFNLSGYINKRNFRIWRTENPHAYIVKPANPKRVTVWCGLWFRGIIGPFSSKMSKKWRTVNGDRYRAMLNDVIWYHCTIICGVLSKISVTRTSQRQLTL